MKKILSLIITLSMVLSLCAVYTVAAENVIFSDSFEDGMGRWTLGNDYAKAGNAVIANDASDGKNSVYAKDDTQESTPNVFSPFIPAKPGGSYTVSADFKHDDAPNIRVYVRFTDSDNKDIANAGGSVSLTTNEWKNGSKTFVAPEGTVNIRLRIAGVVKNVGNGYVDNVKVVEGGSDGSGDIAAATPSAPATDTYGGFYDSFENGMDNWKYTNSKSTEENNKATTEKASDGKTSVLVIDESQETAYGFMTEKYPAKAGEAYTISGDIFNVEGVGAKLFLGFFGSDGQKIVSKSVGTSEVGKWTKVSMTEVAPEGTTSFVAYITGASKSVGKSYIDNVRVICGDGKTSGTPKAETKLDILNKSSIVLFVGSANALVNGQKTLIDKTNDKVIATIVDSRTLVPVRFIAENFGAEVGWDDLTRTVTLTLKDKTVKIVLDKAEIDINGSVTAIDVPAQSIEGRTMLPLRAFVENVMGKKIFWDARGLIVITDTDMLDAEADKAVIDSLVEKIK